MNARIAQLLAGSLLAFAWGAQAVRADDYPTQALGIQPQKAYQYGDVDHVNVFNGNLILSIPIAQRYPVGAGFSYGLNLVYNSNVWDFVETTSGQVDLTTAFPKRSSNAGMGWLLTLGLLQEPYDPGNTTGVWLYVSSDGAEHRLYPSLHNEEPAVGARQYTRDGSYIRMRGTNSDSAVYLDFPDGTTHTFTRFAQYDWRITAISDPFGNGVTITYLNYPAPNWVVTDSLGRQTTVWLEPTTTCPASWGCYQYRVASVVVPAFGTGSATYSFTYQDQVLNRACPSNDPAFPSSFNQSFLVSVTLPDGSSWGMPAGAYTTTTSNCKTYGQLTELVLPTLGQLQWTYGNYVFPTDDGGGKHSWHTGSPGVTVRSALNASGGVLGSWIYTPSLTSYPPDPTHPVEAVRLVQTPLNHTAVNYFSVAQGSPPAPWSVAEYGLPLTHNQTDPYTGYPLSTQVYPCVVTNPASPPCGVLRSTYLAYGTDTNQSGDVTEQTHLNQRVANRRVVYNDDSNQSTGYVYSNFDGLGHYRQADLSGNFPSGGNALTTVTDFNPGNGAYPGAFVLPDVNGPWVLATYDYQTRQQGSLVAKIEACFDPSTGFLLRKRVLQYGTSEGPHDLLTVFTPGSTGNSRGNVVTEDYFGGDTQNLSGLCGSTCACSLGTGQYRINKTYPSGTLATSQYLGAPFYSLNRTIDPSTGLPSASQDSSGLTTTYSYDPMGRIQSISPPGQLTTHFTYTPATPSAQAKVDITTDSDATHSSLLFDDLGRVTEESRLDPSGYNFRQTLYDGAGNQASVSEWGSFGNKTQYRFYDPFGRPQQIQSPDGHLAQLSYHGVREVDRTVSIAVAGGEQGETTRELYDAQGRLQQVQEPPGGTVTTYGYDVGDRLSSVTSTGSGATQTRSFSYDNRGFLLSEQHPEKGPGGNGFVTHGGYDPLGHAGNLIDGPNNLSFSYDAAGRLVQVTDGNHGNRTLKQLSYSAGNGSSGSGFSLGKLLQSSRYNYITASGNPVTAEIRHNYLYGDGSVTQNVGRVTNRTTRFFVNGGANAAETYSQTFSYDSLGSVQALGYPQCIAGGCGAAAGANSVTFNYSRNLLTSVPGYADAITYSPGRQVAQVQHHNGLTDTIAPDPYFMPRPGSIATALTSNPSTLYWSTGAYAYDGEGNIESIGAASFVYDPVSRLTASTLYTDPVTPTHAVTQSAAFDAFGNIQSITTNGVTTNTPTSSINRLTAPTTYDAAGNVTGWNGQTYVLDAFNQMIRFCASGCGSGEDWTYMYDADDERTWLFKNYQNTYRRTLRDLGGKVLRDYFNNATSSTVEDYVYRDGQLLGAQITEDGLAQPARHFSLDHLGTPRLITTSPGAGSAFYSLTPCRILDTRQTGVPLTQTNPQQVYQVSGVCGVPANAVAVAFNATLVGATTNLSVQGYPGDLAPPGTNVVSATLPDKSTIAGFAVLPLAANGGGTLGVLMTLTPPATSGQTDLVLDVTGYFAPTSAPSVAAYHVYFPDGLEATSFAQDSERMKFTGHERDLGDPSSQADDLDYMHARYYKPLIGRFLSVDSGPIRPESPQSWNRYSYVRNNVLALVDPTGRDDVAAIGTGVPTGSTLSLDNAKGNGLYVAGLLLALGYAYTHAGSLAEESAALLDDATAAGGTASTGSAEGVAAQMAQRILGDPNKLNHIFSDKHLAGGLADLVDVFGSRENLVNGVSSAVANLGLSGLNASAAGVFRVTVMVGGEVVQVTGSVINGVPVIGDFWVHTPL